jgi:hypothetical protein
MKIKHCQYCHQEFVSTHGNQNYCPNKDCSYLAKLDRQNKNYDIGDDAKKAIQKNYTIFLNILGENIKSEFDLLLVLKKGFDSNCKCP